MKLISFLSLCTFFIVVANLAPSSTCYPLAEDEIKTTKTETKTEESEEEVTKKNSSEEEEKPVPKPSEKEKGKKEGEAGDNPTKEFSKVGGPASAIIEQGLKKLPGGLGDIFGRIAGNLPGIPGKPDSIPGLPTDALSG